jgi:chromosome partitioning protein
MRVRGADSGGERGGRVPRSKQDNARAVPVIAFFNQKGGTAKTTSTLNVGAALAERGHKTLAIDLDPQASLTMALGVDVLTLERSSYDLLVDDDIEIKDVVMPTTIDGLSVVPSHPDLAAAELQLLNALERERALARKLTPEALAALDVEYLLIDSPPSLNVVSINILVAAEYLVIPIEPHPLSVMVLPKLFEMVGRVQRLNPKLQIIGFLPTKVHTNSRLALDMIDDLRVGFPKISVLPPIPLTVLGAAAVAAYTSVLAYSPKSPIAEAYRKAAAAIAKEVGQ